MGLPWDLFQHVYEIWRNLPISRMFQWFLIFKTLTCKDHTRYSHHVTPQDRLTLLHLREWRKVWAFQKERWTMADWSLSKNTELQTPKQHLWGGHDKPLDFFGSLIFRQTHILGVLRNPVTLHNWSSHLHSNQYVPCWSQSRSIPHSSNHHPFGSTWGY
jgi:hypothetical protein